MKRLLHFLAGLIRTLIATMTKPLFCILIASLLAGCGSAGERDYELNETSFGSDTLQKVQSDSGIKFPAGARGLKFYYKAPIDPSFAAKIEIPQGAKEEIIRTLSAIKHQKINISGELGPRMSWWIPKGANILLDRQANVDGNYLRATLTDENGSVLLYIEWAIF